MPTLRPSSFSVSSTAPFEPPNERDLVCGLKKPWVVAHSYAGDLPDGSGWRSNKCEVGGYPRVWLKFSPTRLLPQELCQLAAITESRAACCADVRLCWLDGGGAKPAIALTSWATLLLSSQ